MTAPTSGVAARSGGSVADNLWLFRGVWRDVLTGHSPDGSLLEDDSYGGTPGNFPYQQLVYLDFDGEEFAQTNVVLAGRPAHERTFRGRIVDGVLEFNRLGPGAPKMIGVSGGPGVLVFLPLRCDEPTNALFYDPDYIRHLGGEMRTRTTTLYRDGLLRRILTVHGTRLSPDPSQRVLEDPRGPEGPVHEGETLSRVYLGGDTETDAHTEMSDLREDR